MNNQGNPSEQRVAELERRVAELENQLACSKEAETELRESERLQRAILDNIPDPAWVKSLDGRFAAVNRAWCVFTGSTQDQVIGRSDAELFPPEVATRLQEQDRTVAETGQTHRFGETLSDSEGRVLTFETFKVPLMDLSGRVTAIIGIARDITERGKMEQELCEEKTRLEQLAAHSRTMAWEVDATGLLTYVSPVVELLLGYRPEELVGRLHFYDLHPEADREEFRRAAFAQFERRESFVDLINPVLTKDGRVRWCSTNGLPVVGPDGNLLGYRGSDRDITEAQQAETQLCDATRALRESEESLQFVLKGSGLGTWDWNLETGKVKRNDYWAEMLGYTPDEVNEATTGNWLNLVHQDDRERAWRSIEDSLAGRTAVHEIEYRMLARDGSYRWILDRARVVRRDSEGRAERMSGTHQDVTERKRMEESLRESEERYRNLIMHSPDAIFVNQQDRLTLVNHACVRLFGANDAEQLLGKSPYELFDPEFHEAIRQRIHRLRGGSEVAPRLEERIVRLDGTRLDVEVVGAAFPAGGVNVIHVILRDISVRKQAEAELRRHRDGLEEMVRERTVALRENEEKFRVLFEGTRDAILLIDDTGCIRDCNSSAVTMFGCTSKPDLLRYRILDLSPKRQLNDRESRDVFFEYMQSIVAGGNHLFEWQSQKADGTEFPVEVSVTPLEIHGRRLFHGAVRDVSDRKRAEATLRERETNFRTFIDTIDDLMVATSLDGRILFANRALREKLRYSDEELTNLAVLDLHPAESRREAGEIFAAMLRGERDSCPLPMAGKDGAILPVETRIWLGRWNGADCIFGVSRDLSAEKEAEQRFERLFRRHPDLVAITSLPDNRFFDINDAFLTKLGYSRDEIVGRNNAELGLLPQDEQLESLVGRLAADGHVEHVELQVRCKDGSILDGLFSGELINHQGRQYALTVMVDITGRKQMEATLRKLSQAVEFSPSMILITDPEGRVDYVNPTWERVTGYRLEEVRGQKPHAMRSGVHSREFYSHLWSEITAGRVWRGEFCNRRKNGELYWESAAIAPVHNDTGEITHYVGVKEDITRRREMEEQLRQWNVELERRVTERTAELTAAQDRVVESLALVTQSEEKFRAMFEQAPLGVALIDSQTGRIHEANPRFAEIVGRTREEMVAIDWMSITHPDDVQPDLDNMARLNAGEIAGFQMAKRYVRSDGSAVWVNMTIAPMTVKAGQGPSHLCMIEDITERKEAEDRLRAIGDNLPGGAVYQLLMPRNGPNRYTYMSAGVRAVFGISAEQVLANPDEFWDLILEEDRPHLNATQEDAARKLTQFVCEFRQRAIDGRIRWLHVRSMPRRLADGSLLWDGALFDITEHKQMESELRQWADAFAHCAHGIALGMPGTNRILACNAAMARMLGKSLEQIAGSPILSLYAPEDHDAVRSCIAEADRVGQVRYESHMVRSDGSIFPVQMDVVSVRGDDGVPVYRVATAQDISERQLAEIALRGAEMRRNLALEGAKAGTWEWKLDTGENVWSRELWQVYGLAPNSVEPSYEAWRQTLHPEDRNRTEQALQEIVRQEAELNLEWRVVDANGGVRWLMSRGRPVRDANGRVTSYLGVVIDVTDHKQMEQVIIQRTREVAEANARLAVLDHAKTDFLRLISHELRTPLNGMFGIAELMFDMVADSPRALKYSKLYDESRQRIMTLIDDALLLCEISAGVDHGKQVPCELAVLLQQARQGADFLAQTLSVELAPLPQGRDLVLGVPQHLVRALQSLIETAVKFARSGSVVGLTIQPVPRGISLIIETEGRSIPPEVLPRFFQLLAFAQTLTSGGDLGLAPALAERIVTFYGGTVTVENQDPPGIRFTVRLRTPADEDEDALGVSDSFV